MKANVALRLGRVSNLPTVASNVLTGAALSRAELAPQVLYPLIALWTLSAALSYVGGMYLNDAFDRGWDAAHRPERPIPSGAVSARTVFTLGFAMLLLGLALSAVLSFGEHGGGVPALLAAAALPGVIVIYDLHHKQNPIAPLLMGCCRVLVYAMVALGLAGHWDQTTTLAVIGLLFYLIGLTYVARQETLRTPASWWPLAFLAAPFLVSIPHALDAQAVCFVLLLIATLLALRLLFRTGKRDIGGAVGQLIAGISLVDALLVAPLRPAYVVPCVVAYVLTRLLQLRIAGT